MEVQQGYCQLQHRVKLHQGQQGADGAAGRKKLVCRLAKEMDGGEADTVRSVQRSRRKAASRVVRVWSTRSCAV